MRGHFTKVPGSNWVILAIPKVAASSIRHAILEAGGHDTSRRSVHRHPALERMRLDEVRERGLYIATFVRHPLDRLVSCYEDKIKRRMASGFRRIGYRRSMAFREFVEHVWEVGPDENVHTARQTWFLDGRRPDFVGEYESLEADWGELRLHVELPVLPHRNATDRRPWREYYGEWTEALARELYQPDFACFSYEFA